MVLSVVVDDERGIGMGVGWQGVGGGGGVGARGGGMGSGLARRWWWQEVRFLEPLPDFSISGLLWNL